MRASVLLILAAVALLAGCTRSNVYSYAKRVPNEESFNQDVQALGATRGVTKVIPRIDTRNNAVIELYVDENDSMYAQKRAIELGYVRLRN